MLRLIKYISIALFTILAVAVLGILMTDSKVYTNYLKEITIAEARRKNISVEWGNSTLSPRVFTAYDLHFVIPRTFFPLYFKVVRILPTYLSFLTLKPSGLVELFGYDGKISSVLTIKNGSETMPQSLVVENLQLAMHPQISALGIQHGALSLSFPNIQGDSPRELSTDGSLNLQDLSKPNPSILPARLSGLPGDIPIPPLTNLSFKSDVSVKRSNVTFSNFNLTSSLGNCVGQISLLRGPRGEVESIESDLKVAMTQEGSKAFGLYLTIGSQGVVDQNTSEFRVVIRGPLNHPQVRWWPGSGRDPVGANNANLEN